MAVSKRVRYEVLRRDNHACRYCGATAPDVALTVDHVVPTSLGGSDDPRNLVAACRDCNSGKASVAPDSPLVADVERDALRWSAAIRRAAEIERKQRSDDSLFFGLFLRATGELAQANPRLELPAFDDAHLSDWQRTITQFRDVGLDHDDLMFAIEKAMANRRLAEDQIWRYFCGVAWRMVEDRQQKATELLQAEEAD